jgi:hypothetical protein
MSGHECEPVWVMDPSADRAAGFCACGQGWVKEGVFPVAKVEAVVRSEMDRFSVARTLYAAPADAPPHTPYVLYTWHAEFYNQTAMNRAVQEALEQLLRKQDKIFQELPYG